MDSSMKMLFSLLFILCVLFATVKTNNSSDQIILSSKPRKSLSALITSTNGNLSDIHRKEGSPILFLGDVETYFTNQCLKLKWDKTHLTTALPSNRKFGLNCDHSSDQIILSSKPRKPLPALSNSTNGNLSDIHRKEGSPILFLGDFEKYFTNQWLTQFLPAVEVLVFVLGLPLNALAIHIFVTKTKLWKPAMVYMLNLAFADLLMLSMLPLKITYLFSGHNWFFGPTMCQLATSIIFCNTYCSILLMTGISLDRFLALVCPMKSLLWRTARRASVVCFAIWLLAIVGASPLLVFDITLWIPQMNITTCFEAQTISASVEFISYYLFAVSIFLFFIPLLITTACYICIIRQLLLTRFMVRQRRKRRAIFLSSIVLCTFFLCFGPSNILLLMQLFFSPEQLQSIIFVYMLSLSLSAFNCCLDPLIYYYASSECQRQVWSVLCPKKLLLDGKGSQTSSNTAPPPKGLDPSFPI